MTNETKKSTTRLREKVEELTKATRNIPSDTSVESWVSFGCTLLDMSISNQAYGGIALGHMTQIYGGASTGKTALASAILGSAVRLGHSTYFADVERTFNEYFAGLFGLDTKQKNFKLDSPQTIEELFDEYIPNILNRKSKNPAIVVVDSLTALPTEVEVKEKLSDGTYGTSRAKQISKALRKLVGPLSDTNTTLFFIDQTRTNMAGFGKAEVVSGGKGPEFYSSTRIYLKYDGKIINKNEIVIGVWVKFVVEKNKVGVPFKEGRFKILFNYGIDDIDTNLWFLSFVQNGKQKASQKTTKIELFGEEKKRATWVQHIEEQGLELDLKTEVFKVWSKLNEFEARKPRSFE